MDKESKVTIALVSGLIGIVVIVAIAMSMSNGSYSSELRPSTIAKTSATTAASTPETNKAMSPFELTEDISYQGITFKADKSWKPTSEDWGPNEQNKKGALQFEFENDPGIVLKAFISKSGKADYPNDYFNDPSKEFELCDEYRYGDNNELFNKFVRTTDSDKNHVFEAIAIFGDTDSGVGLMMKLIDYPKRYDRRYVENCLLKIVDTLNFNAPDAEYAYEEGFEIYKPELPTTKTTTPPTTTKGNSSWTQITASQENALSKAEDLVRVGAYSYNRIIELLEFEGFSHEDATFAADECGAVWRKEAAEKASDYNRTVHPSRERMIELLEFDGFTHEQAEHGADSVGL